MIDVASLARLLIICLVLFGEGGGVLVHHSERLGCLGRSPGPLRRWRPLGAEADVRLEVLLLSESFLGALPLVSEMLEWHARPHG